MTKLIKLKLIGLGYNKERYNPKGLMNWLDEKNDIIFITKLELINFNIFIQTSYEFLIPCIFNYKDYLKIKKQYGGLPITLNKYYSDYLKWLESIDFYKFIDQNSINYNTVQECWHIYPCNYKSIKKINSELEKKSIKIKKLKI